MGHWKQDIAALSDPARLSDRRCETQTGHGAFPADSNQNRWTDATGALRTQSTGHSTAESERLP
eukprot:2544577-Rhodomonas_salina.1